MQLAQIPGDTTLQVLVNAGAVTILALALLALAYALLQTQRNKGKDDVAENMRQDKLIDSLVNVFTELKEDRIENRKIIADNSETQRLTVVAQNENTGAVRQMAAELKAYALDLKTYQHLGSDAIEELTTDMSAFVQNTATKLNTTVEIVERAIRNHDAIFRRFDNQDTTLNEHGNKLDTIIQRLPPVSPTPASVINITNTGAPAGDKVASADGEGSAAA